MSVHLIDQRPDGRAPVPGPLRRLDHLDLRATLLAGLIDIGLVLGPTLVLILITAERFTFTRDTDGGAIFTPSDQVRIDEIGSQTSRAIEIANTLLTISGPALWAVIALFAALIITVAFVAPTVFNGDTPGRHLVRRRLRQRRSRLRQSPPSPTTVGAAELEPDTDTYLESTTDTESDTDTAVRTEPLVTEPTPAAESAPAGEPAVVGAPPVDAGPNGPEVQTDRRDDTHVEAGLIGDLPAVDESEPSRVQPGSLAQALDVSDRDGPLVLGDYSPSKPPPPLPRSLRDQPDEPDLPPAGPAAHHRDEGTERIERRRWPRLGQITSSVVVSEPGDDADFPSAGDQRGAGESRAEPPSPARSMELFVEDGRGT